MKLVTWCEISVRYAVNIGILIILADKTLAQIAPDNTLPNNSSVRTLGDTTIINGGTSTGRNIFHSFSDFSVSTGSTVYFNNALDIQNIITRVTGGSISNINGLIRANGNANLFLINPSGIVFGQNASLNIGGSLLATTANAVEFGKDGFFSASNLENSSLLTINPSALLFNQITPGSIKSQSVAKAGLNLSGDTTFGLRVPDGRSLVLVGGDVHVESVGFINDRTTPIRGGLKALGGRIELGGVSAPGTVGLNIDNNNINLNFPAGLQRADVFLDNGADINVRASDGGSIRINARNLNMKGASLLRTGIGRNIGTPESTAGDIEINATETVQLTNAAILNLAQSGGIGKVGNVNITADTLSMNNGAQINVINFEGADAGNISIQARALSIMGGSILTATTLKKGNAGNISVNASDSVILSGYSPTTGYSSGFFSSTGDNAEGQGGDITVNTGLLRVSDGAALSAITRNSFRGGNIFVNANSLEITNGGQLLTTAYSSGQAGKITINANDNVKIVGSDPSFDTRLVRFGKQSLNTLNSSSGLFANTEENSTAQGGSITVLTPELILQNGAQVAVDSSGSGNAGSIDAIANYIRLDSQATLNANTSGNEGNIRLRTNELILSHNSDITTNAAGENAIGGNINIDANVLAAFEDSDISANSENFRGGEVRINATGIFGTQSRAVSTSLSDITATGGTPQFSGTVKINTPDINYERGLEKLPVALIDAARLILHNLCIASQGSKFIITGRGGLPESPQQTQQVDTGWEDWRIISDNRVSNQELRATPINSNRNSSQIEKQREKIVEATGWVIDSQGDVILTKAPVITAQTPNFNSLNCHI